MRIKITFQKNYFAVLIIFKKDLINKLGAIKSTLFYQMKSRFIELTPRDGRMSFGVKQ